MSIKDKFKIEEKNKQTKKNYTVAQVIYSWSIIFILN